mgnify:CR=1 FL=1
MSKLSLIDVTNITGSESAAMSTINNNSQSIETAFENTLSRDGTSPNQMLSDLDMNSNDIMNVGTIDVEGITIDGVAVSAGGLTAKGDKGDKGDTGPQGPAGTTSPVATTSVTGTVTLGTFAQAIAGSPTGAYAPTLDVIKAIIDMVCPVGTVSGFFQMTPPAYWLALDGTTIGDGSSGATARANADTVNLFTLLWNNVANSELSIQTSSGIPSTRGISAAADFAAHKRLPLPDTKGQFFRGLNTTGSGTDASRIIGSVQSDQNKAHTHTGTTSTNGTHHHSYNIGQLDQNGGTAADGAGSSGAPTTSDDGAHNHTFTTNSDGGTEARPTNMSILYAIRY